MLYVNQTLYICILMLMSSPPLLGNSYLHLFRSYINFYIHLITLNLISYKTDIYT